MPPKSVTCSVCNENVLKSQTLARQDGSRACRSHEGVTEESRKLVDADKARLKHEIANPKRKPWEPDPEHRLETKAAEFREYACSHCWTCECEGMQAGEYFSQVLIAMKRLEIRKEFNFFTFPQEVKKLIPEVMLAQINFGNDRAIQQAIKDYRIKDIIHILGFALLCPTCVDKFGYRSQVDEMLPRPSFEDLANFVPVVQEIDPLLTELAERKENQS